MADHLVGAELAVEQLEARQLLALTISDDVIRSGTDIAYTDTESITVSPNVILNAGGGKITLTAPVITISSGAKLLSKGTGGAADGAITLEARDAQAPSNTGEWLVDILSGFAKDTATITIGAGTRIDGGTIQIKAFAGNDQASFSNDPLTAIVSHVPGALVTLLTDIVSLLIPPQFLYQCS